MLSVSKYDVARGILILDHSYSRADRTRTSRNAIDVDINLLLESIKHTELQVGSWLNVVGYVRRQGIQESTATGIKRSGPSVTLRSATDGPPIYIEAIMAFSAGAIHVGEYERVLQDAQDADRRLNRPQ